MPNRNKNVSPAHVPGHTTLSHETAKILTSLSMPLKGTKNEILKELNAVMHVQVSYIINAIEDIVSNPSIELQSAITLYLEAQCKHHYVSNDIDN